MTSAASPPRERLPNRPPRPALLCGFSTILTVAACVTCVRIETLNHRLGGVLPRQEINGGIPKWRGASGRVFREATEARLRQDRLAHLDGDDDRTDAQLRAILDQPLTQREKTELDELCHRNDLEASLYGWLTTMGMLQYAILPLALASSLWCLLRAQSRWRRAYSSVLIFSCLICVVLLFHRAYFSSLGW